MYYWSCSCILCILPISSNSHFYYLVVIFKIISVLSNVAQIMCLISILILEKAVIKKVDCQLKATKIGIFHFVYWCSSFFTIFNLLREKTAFCCFLQELINRCFKATTCYIILLVLFAK